MKRADDVLRKGGRGEVRGNPAAVDLVAIG
jgi:hypothetical protein